MKAAPDTSTLRQRLDFIEIDDATRKTLRELRPTLSALLAGVTIVSSTGVALADMISRIDGVNKFVGDIAAAAKDQAIGVAEVSAAVRNMDTITQQNAAMVERTSAETRHLRNEANTLVALLSGFKTQADIRNGNMQGEKRRAA